MGHGEKRCTDEEYELGLEERKMHNTNIDGYLTTATCKKKKCFFKYGI